MKDDGYYKLKVNIAHFKVIEKIRIKGVKKYERIRKSAETYLKQVTKILNKEKTRIEYNSKWLSKMNFEDIIKLSSKYTVARIMERDDFKNRFENNLPLSMHELLYPLMQGYDSVALNADIEIGGTDQTFNLLVGRELQKDYEQDSQVVITFPLLVGLDGKEKMSKSLGNYIGIDELPEIMYEKSMKIPDEVLMEYFKLTTDIDIELAKRWINEDIVEAHKKYAREIIKMYHGEKFIKQAEEKYEIIANGGIPSNIKEAKLDDIQEISICDLLVRVEFAKSKGEAKRMIQGKGVKIDSQLIEDINKDINLNKEVILQFGKNKFIKII